jgi:hypothetical protein
MCYLKMRTVQERSICVCLFFRTKYIIKMQHCYRTHYGKYLPSDPTFQETVSVLHYEGMERSSTSQENVDSIQEVFS